MRIDPHLAHAFGSAAPEHFEWQVSHPVVSDEERRLVVAAFAPAAARILDLGCGEGGTLRHLGEPAGAVGVDLFPDKLRFAKEHVRGARFVAASADALPFPDAAFDQVVVRDVLHHVPAPSRLLAECRRVLAPGGRVDVLEPNRYNPLVFVHAMLNRAERGELRSSAARLARLVSTHFALTSVTRHQPMPIHRVAFHPQFGVPEWASRPAVRWAVERAERIAGWIVPRPAWAYVHLRGEVPKPSLTPPNERD
jgi:ubiquinone/menaquinone biosynthesis C-methylase UbiE